MSIINEHWNDSVRELGGTGLHYGRGAGQVDPRAYLDTDRAQGTGVLIVGFNEYLKFATERGDIPAEMLDQGWLTESALPRVREAIAEILKERSALSDAVINTLSVENVSGGSPTGIAVEVTTPVDDPRTVEEVFDKVMDSFWAALVDMLDPDPGTYNYPYLWSRLA